MLCDSDSLVEFDEGDIDSLADVDSDALLESAATEVEVASSAAIESDVLASLGVGDDDSAVDSAVDVDSLATADTETTAGPADSLIDSTGAADSLAAADTETTAGPADSLIDSTGAADSLATADSLDAPVLRFACSGLALVLMFPLPSFLENWLPVLVLVVPDWLVLCDVDSLVDSVAESLVAPVLPGVRTVLPSVARVFMLSALTSYENGVWSDTIYSPSWLHTMGGPDGVGTSSSGRRQRRPDLRQWTVSIGAVMPALGA